MIAVTCTSQSADDPLSGLTMGEAFGKLVLTV